MPPARAARLLFQLPTKSRVYSVIDPANQWGWDEILSNKANYLLELLVWQKSNEGLKKSKQTKQPEPFLPDFIKKKMPINKGIQSHSVNEVQSILDLPRG